MSNAARKERKRLQRNLRDFGQRSQAAALWEPEQKVPTRNYRPNKEEPYNPALDAKAIAAALQFGRAAWESKVFR